MPVLYGFCKQSYSRRTVPKIKMAARSITANISNKLNVIAKNLERAPKPDKITFDGRRRPGPYSQGAASCLPPAYFKWNKPGVKPPILYWDEPKSDWMKHPETGERIRTNRVPLRVEYPKESKLGLWSGEGIVRGFIKPDGNKGKRRTKMWKPLLTTKDFYSEILDRTLNISVTQTTLDMIDDSYGFDFYILKTPANVLNSMLGMVLKRNMLLRLADRDKVYPDDPEKRDRIYRRYGGFVVPKEEAEWVGLSRSQAVAKQRQIESKENPLRPLQDIFTKELLAQLREEQAKFKSVEFPDGLENKSRPFLSRLFGSSSKNKEDNSST